MQDQAGVRNTLAGAWCIQDIMNADCRVPPRIRPRSNPNQGPRCPPRTSDSLEFCDLMASRADQGTDSPLLGHCVDDGVDGHARRPGRREQNVGAALDGASIVPERGRLGAPQSASLLVHPPQRVVDAPLAAARVAGPGEFGGGSARVGGGGGVGAPGGVRATFGPVPRKEAGDLGRLG